MKVFSSDNTELTIHDFASCSIGESSSIVVTNTSKEILGKIRIDCGIGCKIAIRGINVLNSGLSIFMAHDAIFDMGPRQAFNGYFSFSMHEPSEIKIGSDCLWGSGELMTSDCHSIIDCVTRERINPAGNIIVSDRVWLGGEVKVLKGATIGSDTVIAARSIVGSGEYPDNSLLAGIPAKVVKSGIAWDPRLL